MPISIPTVKVEVAFANSALETGTLTWTDITSYTRSGSLRVGRTNELEDFSTGTLNLVLDNRARTFDPFYASSISPTGLKARRLIRLTATYNSVTYALFKGHVAGWPLAPQVDGDSTTNIEAYDGLAYLAAVDLPADFYSYTVTTIASANLLAWWPLGTTDVLVADKEDTYTFTNTTATPKTGSAPSNWLTGSSQTYDGTYGAIGSAVNTTSAFTVSFFFKTNTAGPSGGFNPILASADSTNPACIGIDELGRLAYRRGSSNTGHSGFRADDDLWHHAVVSYAGSGAIKIYVDGVLLSTGNTTGTGGDANGWQLIAIANGTTTDSGYYTGDLAHISIWNTELTAAQVEQLAAAGLRGVPSTGTTTTDWITQVLNAAGWPTAWREKTDGTTSALDTGTVQPGGMKWGTSALSVLQALARTEGGRIFVNGSGNVMFLNRTNDFTATRSTTSQATYSDSGVAGTVRFSSVGGITYSDEFLANQVTVTTSQGAAFVASDTTSQTTYGIRARQIETLLDSQSDAQTYASIHVQQYAEPILRIKDWMVIPQRDPSTSYPKVLGAKLADRITFELQPNRIGTRISQQMIVEQIAHTFTPETWNTTFTGSPAIQPWLLEDATYGLLGQTTILG